MIQLREELSKKLQNRLEEANIKIGVHSYAGESGYLLCWYREQWHWIFISGSSMMTEYNGVLDSIYKKIQLTGRKSNEKKDTFNKMYDKIKPHLLDIYEDYYENV